MKIRGRASQSGRVVFLPSSPLGALRRHQTSILRIAKADMPTRWVQCAERIAPNISPLHAAQCPLVIALRVLICVALQHETTNDHILWESRFLILMCNQAYNREHFQQLLMSATSRFGNLLLRITQIRHQQPKSSA